MASHPLKLTAIVLCAFVFPVHAINKSGVVNETGHPIVVAWTALGCFKNKFLHPEVCKGVVLDRNEYAEYQYHWGATNDNIHLGIYFEPIKHHVVAGSTIGIARDFDLPIKIGNHHCRLHSYDRRILHVRSVEIDPETLKMQCVHYYSDM